MKTLSFQDVKRLYPAAYAQLIDGFDSDEDLESTDIEFYVKAGALHSRSRDEGTENVWDVDDNTWYDV